VHTEDGPSDAWVYIDHRVNPGPPRPGYLERIIDGAVHHGLPQRWIDFLRRWDPSRWPRPRSRPTTPAPQSLSELLSDVSGWSRSAGLRSRFSVFLAIHGGGLEEMDRRDRRGGAADASDASVYLVADNPEPLSHNPPVVGALFTADESARLAEFLDHVDIAVSLHGYGRIGRATQLLAGGHNRATGRPCGRPSRPARLSSRHPTSTRFRSSCAGCIRRTRSIRTP